MFRPDNKKKYINITDMETGQTFRIKKDIVDERNEEAKRRLISYNSRVFSIENEKKNQKRGVRKIRFEDLPPEIQEQVIQNQRTN